MEEGFKGQRFWHVVRTERRQYLLGPGESELEGYKRKKRQRTGLNQLSQKGALVEK